MTIRADEDTFLCLRAQRRNRVGDALTAQSNALLLRLEVVELKGAQEPVITANTATSTCFRDQRGFHLLAVANDSVGAAPSASVVAASFEDDLRRPVVPA